MSPKTTRQPISAAMTDAIAKTGPAHQVTPCQALEAAAKRLGAELDSARWNLRYHLDAAKEYQKQIEELTAQRWAVSTLREQVQS